MVAVLLVIIGGFGSGFFATNYQIIAALEIDHRHAQLGKAEMVGAIIKTLFRCGLHFGGAVFGAGGCVQIGIELGLTHADYGQVFGGSSHRKCVHINAADGLA